MSAEGVCILLVVSKSSFGTWTLAPPLAEVSLGQTLAGGAVRFLSLRKQRASALQTHVTPCQWDGVLSLSTSSLGIPSVA